MNKRALPLLIGIGCASAIFLFLWPSRNNSALIVSAAEGPTAAVSIDYPRNGSVIPPEITPPTFIWRDASESAAISARAKSL